LLKQSTASLLLLLVVESSAHQATITGFIGHSAKELSLIDGFTPRESKGGCRVRHGALLQRAMPRGIRADESEQWK
ncbi:hypothetical protein PFISCL1PPCAC_7529, partial [Pristionchus fissidentatus]